MKRGRINKKILAFALAAVMILSLAGCGKDEGQPVAEGFVYVPEFYDLSAQEGESNISNLVLRGEDLYYSTYFFNEETGENGQIFWRRNIQSGDAEELSLNMNIEGAGSS